MIVALKEHNIGAHAGRRNGSRGPRWAAADHQHIAFGMYRYRLRRFLDNEARRLPLAQPLRCKGLRLEKEPAAVNILRSHWTSRSNIFSNPGWRRAERQPGRS
jgi:hypothetical protein